MNEYDINRKKELEELLKNKEIYRLPKDSLDTVIELENEMTDNKNSLVDLHEKNIIGDQELELKIKKCFDVFLAKIVSEVGEDFCKTIYDFLPGEDLGFLEGFKKNRLTNMAHEFAEMTSELRDKISEIYGQPQREPVAILQMVELLSCASDAMAHRIKEEHEVMVVINKGIMADIDKIDKMIIPAANAQFRPAGVVRDIGNNVNAIKNHLTLLSGQINKISEG